MKLHANARTCPNSRRLLVDRIVVQQWSVTAAAEAAGVTERTAYRWLARYRNEGPQGLLDRSCAPKRIPHKIAPARVAAIASLRRLRMTALEIAELLEMAHSTVSLWLRRLGLGKRSRLEPPEPPNRYQRRRAGELVHVDVKKLGRIARPGHRVTGRAAQWGQRRAFSLGWEFVHVCVDDATRLAYVEVLADERGPTAAGFLGRAVGWFKGQGVRVERVMSDNGACYRSSVHAAICRELEIRHLFTRPYRPRTNGKAERFIRTLLDEWAYARIYASSAERTERLAVFVERYNWRRPHGSLSRKPPGDRLAELTNVVGNYS